MGATIETGILAYLGRGQLRVVKDDLSDAVKSNTRLPTSDPASRIGWLLSIES